MHTNFEEFKLLNWETIKIPKMLNVSIVILIVISIFVGQSHVSFGKLVNSLKQMPVLILMIPLLIVVYIILHELIHGILMKYISGTSPQYGISFPFIFAKSKAMFDKNEYILITIAPMLIIGTISFMLFFITSGTGVWLAIYLWVINLYASRGDLQAILLLKDIPRTFCIKDEGDSIQIYKPVEEMNDCH